MQDLIQLLVQTIHLQMPSVLSREGTAAFCCLPLNALPVRDSYCPSGASTPSRLISCSEAIDGNNIHRLIMTYRRKDTQVPVRGTAQRAIYCVAFWHFRQSSREDSRVGKGTRGGTWEFSLSSRGTEALPGEPSAEAMPLRNRALALRTRERTAEDRGVSPPAHPGDCGCCSCFLQSKK